MQGTLIPGTASPFELAHVATIPELESEGPVRYLVVSGKQDDGLWGPVGAVWVSADGARGGFLVHPWALWEGGEFVRGYRSALDRGWSPTSIYEYWQREVWPGTRIVDRERDSEVLMLVNEMVAAL